MAQLTITQLPQAQPLAGTESVPISQNGLTVQTTVAAIANSPTQQQTFITVNQEVTLPNSRRLQGGTGVGLMDTGSLGAISITLNGASGSLEVSTNGIIAKTSGNTVVGRTLTGSSTGVTVTNGDGVAGNPVIALNGPVGTINGLGGSGLLTLQNGTSVGSVSIQGTANQIDVANSNGLLGNPTVAIANNPTIPGTGGMVVPSGTTAERGAAINGTIRYNTDTSQFEIYDNGWDNLPTGAVTSVDVSGGVTGLTTTGGPITTSGVITLGGVLNVDSGGTGATTLTGYVKGGGTSPMTASTTIPNTDITGLGTMSTQNSSSVVITGGSIDSTPIGNTTPNAVTGTTISATTQFSGDGAGLTGTAPLLSIGGNAATATDATNVAGGGVNQIPYNTNASTTSFVAAPTSPNTFLEWSGSSFQWTTNPLGTVTSVGLALPSEFTISNSPVTSSGTLTGAWANQTANYIFAAPNGSSGVPSFRAIVAADVPTLNQNTTGSAGSVANSVTFNNTGGSAPNAVFNGSSPVTVDYSTVGAPKADGTGASGTWAINISGNAATATTATSASSATTATNLASGAAGSIPYQTSSGTTTFLAASTGVLVGGTTPSYSTTPTLTGTNFSSIPNSALSNSSVTIGTTSVSLGATSLTLAGLTSVTLTQDPSSALEAATKQYVDTLYTSGVHYHQAVKYEVPDTTGNLNAIYNQPGGPAVGVGATLTNNGTLAAFAPDGPIASIGDRILVYNQTNAFENGIYTVTTVGDGSTAWVLTRATDADTYNPTSPNGLGKGDAFFVTSGNTGAGETYECNTVGAITFGTTAITFVQISSSQVYTAGTGLTLATPTQFALSVPVVAINGGTGQTSYTTGDIIYASNSTTLAKLGIGATNRILTSNGTAPQWSDPASVTVGNATNATTASSATTATTATTATNIAGGAANQFIYNTGSSTTAFAAAPTLSNTFLKWNGSAFTWDSAGIGTVTSVGMTVPTGLVVSGSPVTGSGTLAVTFDTGYSIPTTASQSNWDTAYADRLKWDGGATGLNAPTGRTSLGATTVGSNLFTLSDPSAVTFLRINADNSVSTLNDSSFRSAIGAGTGNGTVTSITAGTYLTGGTITSSGTIAVDATSINTASKIVARDASGDFAAGTITASLSGTATNATNTAITANSANATNYLTFVSATTGNLGQLVNSAITCNPSTGAITGGISGGTF